MSIIGGSVTFLPDTGHRTSDNVLEFGSVPGGLLCNPAIMLNLPNMKWEVIIFSRRTASHLLHLTFMLLALFYFLLSLDYKYRSKSFTYCEMPQGAGVFLKPRVIEYLPGTGQIFLLVSGVRCPRKKSQVTF